MAATGRVVRDAAARELKFRSLAAELRREILAGRWTPGSKLPTDQEVAQWSGLSLTTVRRAFEDLVRQRLVVRRQGSGTFVTQPATPARQRHSVGVLVPDTGQYYPRVLQGVEEALSANGARLQLSCYHYDADEEDRAIEFLLESGVDGLLLVPTLVDLPDPAGRVGRLMSLPVPVVLLERRLPDSGPADFSEHVCSDHEGGAYDAVRHLAALGHHELALISRSHNPTEAAVDRGFYHAVRDLELASPFRCAARKETWNADAADRALRGIRAAGSTAALVFGDREAILLEGAARRAGVDVPGQLALVSYDDETADIAEVPLTAVAPPKYRVGRMAAEVLLRRLDEGNACPLHQVRLRPRLVIRESCGATTTNAPANSTANGTNSTAKVASASSACSASTSHVATSTKTGR
jgi:DNA-binding LacI/PurR family transcriptional regulator